MIAFTAESLPKLFYAAQARLGNGTLAGYTNFSLAYAPSGSVQYAPKYEQQFGGVTCRYGALMPLLPDVTVEPLKSLVFTLCFPQI